MIRSRDLRNFTSLLSHLANALDLTAVPSCQDTFQNQDETDADCGGNICSKRCNDGAKCFMNSDCFGSYCNPAKKCCKLKVIGQSRLTVLCLQRLPRAKTAF